MTPTSFAILPYHVCDSSKIDLLIPPFEFFVWPADHSSASHDSICFAPWFSWVELSLGRAWTLCPSEVWSDIAIIILHLPFPFVSRKANRLSFCQPLSFLQSVSPYFELILDSLLPSLCSPWLSLWPCQSVLQAISLFFLPPFGIIQLHF